ncbi:MAG: effector-associated domain EAD1-containing protein, partial [Scytonema sp. PMC 1069.18]|nr:effector-associated domain EAD1-containing protein [Scytonema sp. PMC 1069.18]
MDLVAGQRRKKLQEAFIDAFPQESLLEQMLLFELDKKLKVIVGSGNNLGEIIFILIQKAESEGWLTDLIRAAHTSNPGNLKLQDFVLDKVDDSQRYENFTEVKLSQAEQEVTCANQKTFVVNTSSKNYSIPLLKSIKLIEEHKYDGKLAV